MVYWKYRINGVDECTDDLKSTIISLTDGELKGDYKDWLGMEINADRILAEFICEEGDLTTMYEDLKEEYAEEQVSDDDEVDVGSITFYRHNGDCPEPDLDDYYDE